MWAIVTADLYKMCTNVNMQFEHRLVITIIKYILQFNKWGIHFH